jgi:AICAR transformylase/IMP cyclohydrolase PurH
LRKLKFVHFLRSKIISENEKVNKKTQQNNENIDLIIVMLYNFQESKVTGNGLAY